MALCLWLLLCTFNTTFTLEYQACAKPVKTAGTTVVQFEHPCQGVCELVNVYLVHVNVSSRPQYRLFHNPLNQDTALLSLIYAVMLGVAPCSCSWSTCLCMGELSCSTMMLESMYGIYVVSDCFL